MTTHNMNAEVAEVEVAAGARKSVGGTVGTVGAAVALCGAVGGVGGGGKGFDVILIEEQLPLMNGTETTKTLRARGTLSM